MGFKVFGTRAGQVSYTLKGLVHPQGQRSGLRPIPATDAKGHEAARTVTDRSAQVTFATTAGRYGKTEIECVDFVGGVFTLSLLNKS